MASVPFSGSCSCCTVECEEECAGCTSCEGDPCAASAACLAECEATRGECITACGMAYDTCYAGCGGDPGCIATCVADNESCEAGCGDPCDEADCPTYADCQDCETAAAACAACATGCPTAFGECVGCAEFEDEIVITYACTDTCGSFACPGVTLDQACTGTGCMGSFQVCDSCTAELGEWPECFAGCFFTACYRMTRVHTAYNASCVYPPYHASAGDPICP